MLDHGSYCEAAAAALKQIGDTRVVVLVCAVLMAQNRSEDVYKATIEVLERIGDVHAVEPLCTVITNWRKYPSFVSERALRILGRIGDVRAVEPLRAYITDAAALFGTTAKLSLARIDEAAATEAYAKLLRIREQEERAEEEKRRIHEEDLKRDEELKLRRQGERHGRKCTNCGYPILPENIALLPDQDPQKLEFYCRTCGADATEAVRAVIKEADPEAVRGMRARGEADLGRQIENLRKRYGL
jgi:hypothetical protein